MALAFVEGKALANVTGTATTAAFTNTFAVGQIVVVAIAYDGGANATTSVTDNATTPNTYTLIAAVSGATGGTYQAIYWSKITTAKASPTVTVNYNSAATNGNLVVQYFNGFTATPTIDQTKLQANASSTTVTSGASSSTTVAAELVVGIGMYVSTATTFTLGAGYTNLTAQNTTNASVALESKVVAATGAQTATFTLGAARINEGAVLTIYDLTTVVGVTFITYKPPWRS